MDLRDIEVIDKDRFFFPGLKIGRETNGGGSRWSFEMVVCLKLNQIAETKLSLTRVRQPSDYLSRSFLKPICCFI